MAQAETVASNEDQSFTFVKGDFKDLPALVTKLQDARDPLSQHILDSFGTVTKRLLEGYDPSRPDDQDLRESPYQRAKLVHPRGARCTTRSASPTWA